MFPTLNSTEADPSQAWFWSPRWASLEKQADDDFRTGRVIVVEVPTSRIVGDHDLTLKRP